MMNKQPAKYTSPTKGHPSKPDSPLPTINTSRDVTRRVWIRKPEGTPTSLYVKESHLVDDLKTMIIEKFPMSLAKMCDPSDIVIKLELALSAVSPSYYNSPSTPGNRKFLAPMSSNTMQLPSPNLNSPLSPIPVSANKSSLIAPKHPTHELGNLSLRSVSPAASLPLEADRPVWSVLDQYYPNGMGIDNAFMIEMLNQVHTESLYPQSGSSNHKKNFSQETITEDKEQDFNYSSHSRRMNSLPPQSGPATGARSSTPGAHRRSQSNPPEHSSAVLLMPATGLEKRNASVSLSSTNDTGSDARITTPDRVLSPQSTLDPQHRPVHSSSPGPRIANGNSTMAKVLPSVNVLIVEDNLINLRILSAHLRRHRIHYDIAKNGQEAIDKWRKGGFHLVLMDIQLPVMSGLEASKTIRRLEKLNHIGVFSQSDLQNLPPRKPEEELDLNIFRSPVIIVALTASNLKQDKQQALAAGCNDYLTKPVNLDWLLNKITEWGCMQALIDFDGWKSGERMTNISAALPSLTRKSSSRRVLSGGQTQYS